MGTTVVNRALDPTLFAPFLNLLANGGMEIWQRGSSFSNPGANVYTADKWQAVLIGSPTFTIGREASIIDGRGSYSLKLNVTAVGGATVCRIVGFVENATAYAGLTVSASARIKCNVANTAKIRLRDSLFNTPSDYHTGDNTWQTLTATQTVYAATSQLYLEIGMIVGDVNVATIYIDNVTLCVGSQPLSFVPLQPAEDLARCLRYYETSLNTEATVPIIRSSTNNYYEYPIQFRTLKAAVPTLTPTKNYIYMYHSPTSGNGVSAADTGNWTANPSTTIDGYMISGQRTTDQTTYPNLNVSLSWTAEVT